MRTRSGQLVFGGSISSVGADARGVQGGTSKERAGSGASRKAAALWRGSGSAKESPSLVPATGDPALEDEARAGAELTIGIGMLGFGLAAMLGGFLVAAVSRRRAIAEAGDIGASAPRNVVT